MATLQQVRELEVVDRGPDWLFVKLRPELEHLDGVASRIWDLLNQQFIHRIVLEMDEVEFLPSVLIGQLVMLHKRIIQRGGAMRLCGLTPQCQESLHLCRLDQALPNFACREDAVRGCSTSKPR